MIGKSEHAAELSGTGVVESGVCPRAERMTMKAGWLTAVAMGVTLLSTSALAQDGGGGVVYEDETVYTFDNEYVDGQVVRPDGDLVMGQRHGKESSLIRIRADFIDELTESVEEL